jgi:pimeloyl-ACP methyl ester carboxylesterase
LSERVYFNDDMTDRGIEGWYKDVHQKRFVYVKPTNCAYDWLRNFLLPRRSWENMAEWLYYLLSTLPERDHVILGYSMGGAVALNLASVLGGVQIKHVYTFGAPKPGRIKLHFPVTEHVHRGDIVPCLPILAPRLTKREYIGEWKPFVQAHESYQYLINMVLSAEGYE